MWKGLRRISSGRSIQCYEKTVLIMTERVAHGLDFCRRAIAQRVWICGPRDADRVSPQDRNANPRCVPGPKGSHRCHLITMVQPAEYRKGLNLAFRLRANFCRR